MEDNKELIHSLLDNRYKDLWEYCNSYANISIKYTNATEYGVYSINENHTIFVPKNNLNPSSFTHELLHIFLEIKGVYIGGSLSLFVKAEKLRGIFSQSLVDHISNCLAHIKMFPLYLEMGFNLEYFIQDYEQSKFSKSEMEVLRNNFKYRKLFFQVYRAKYIDKYIGKYFAMKACPNKNFDYSNGFKLLKELDLDLYNVLSTLR